MAKMLRVALIVQQGVFRSSLRAALMHFGDLEVTDHASVPESGFPLDPDVVILDLDFQPDNHRELMRRMLAVAPNAKTCVLAFRALPAVVRQCLSLGATGFLLKECTVDELHRSIRTAGAGEIAVDARLAGVLLKGTDAERVTGRSPALSDREMEVIRFIALGMTNRQIAQRLSLSEKTVKNHVSHIFRKLKITARTQAAIHAISNNLLKAPERSEPAQR
jgi:DNA-binding NarL/FixJ family response regulator